MKITVYRCGYCGDVTDETGTPLVGMIREDVISLIETKKRNPSRPNSW